MKKLFLIFISIFCLIKIQSQVSNGLIAKYYFNNSNANDDGGKYHGKVNGAVLTTDRFGNPNKAYQFGINQNITVNDTDALDGMNKELSISFWVNSPVVNNYQNFLVSKFSHCGGGVDAYNIGIHSTNTILSQLDDSTGFDAAQIGKKNVSDSKWHHVVVIWNKPNVKIYIDSVLDTYSRNDLFNSSISNSTEELAFGNPTSTFCSTLTFDYNEKLDDIRIYNRALTKKEVDTLFNEPNPCKQTITTINQTVKPGSSYFFKGQNLTTTGIYRDTLKNSIGCDSFIILNLTAFSSISSLETSIRIYPNPSSGIVNFLGLQMPTEIEIFSIDGKRLRRYITKESINISELKPGTYLLKIDGKTYKIILNK